MFEQQGGLPASPPISEKAPPAPIPPPEAKPYFPGDTMRNFILHKYGFVTHGDTWKDNKERTDFQPPQHGATLQLQSVKWEDGTETRRFLVYDSTIADVQMIDISGDEGKMRMQQLADDGYVRVGQLHEQPEGKVMYAFAKSLHISPEERKAMQAYQPEEDIPVAPENNSVPQTQEAVDSKNDLLQDTKPSSPQIL